MYVTSIGYGWTELKKINKLKKNLCTYKNIKAEPDKKFLINTLINLNHFKKDEPVFKHDEKNIFPFLIPYQGEHHIHELNSNNYTRSVLQMH